MPNARMRMRIRRADYMARRACVEPRVYFNRLFWLTQLIVHLKFLPRRGDQKIFVGGSAIPKKYIHHDEMGSQKT
jgi:hypothetical protein